MKPPVLPLRSITNFLARRLQIIEGIEKLHICVARELYHAKITGVVAKKIGAVYRIHGYITPYYIKLKFLRR